MMSLKTVGRETKERAICQASSSFEALSSWRYTCLNLQNRHKVERKTTVPFRFKLFLFKKALPRNKEYKGKLNQRPHLRFCVF